MTDFDQIIKEKVEQKEYPYSASSWHSFAKKAGLKSALTASQSIVIAVLSVAVISVGSWLGIRYLSPGQEVVPAAEVTVEELPAPGPALMTTDTVATEITEETAPAAEPPAPSRKVTPKEAPKAPAADTAKASKQVKEPILRPKNPRRILEIDPDTIKSNE